MGILGLMLFRLSHEIAYETFSSALLTVLSR